MRKRLTTVSLRVMPAEKRAIVGWAKAHRCTVTALLRRLVMTTGEPMAQVDFLCVVVKVRSCARIGVVERQPARWRPTEGRHELRFTIRYQPGVAEREWRRAGYEGPAPTRVIKRWASECELWWGAAPWWWLVDFWRGLHNVKRSS